MIQIRALIKPEPTLIENASKLISKNFYNIGGQFEYIGRMIEIVYSEHLRLSYNPVLHCFAYEENVNYTLSSSIENPYWCRRSFKKKEHLYLFGSRESFEDIISKEPFDYIKGHKIYWEFYTYTFRYMNARLHERQ